MFPLQSLFVNHIHSNHARRTITVANLDFVLVNLYFDIIRLCGNFLLEGIDIGRESPSSYFKVTRMRKQEAGTRFCVAKYVGACAIRVSV